MPTDLSAWIKGAPLPSPPKWIGGGLCPPESPPSNGSGPASDLLSGGLVGGQRPPTRLGSVFVPHIALQAALRRNPELRGTPVALHEASLGRDGRVGRARITTVSAEARRAGVRAGVTCAQATAA